MKTELNCCRKLDEDHSKLWSETRDLIDRKYDHLIHLHPDLDKAVLRIQAKRGQASVHLTVHDGKHRLLDSHASGRRLNRSIADAFKRAERLLGKPKHRQKAA